MGDYTEHLIRMAGGDGDELDQIQRRIKDCQTYKFGMYNADKLAHEDAPHLLALVREQQARIDRVRELHVPVMEDGNAVGCSMCDWEHPDGSAWPCGTLAALTATVQP